MGVNAQAMSGLIQDDNINKENQSPSIAGECSPEVPLLLYLLLHFKYNSRNM